MVTQQSIPVNMTFSGSIPANYEDYLGPLFFEPFARYMAECVEKLKPSSVLELACGTGRLTRHLHATLPTSASLIATDINPDMIAYGNKKLLNIDWRVVDATSIPFEDETFDCIVAQFGVMFYSDRIKAFEEAYRTLKPGGSFVYSAWDKLQHNIAANITHQVVAKFFPDNSPVFYQVGPFSYHDEAVMHLDLAAASFKTVEIRLVRLQGSSETSEAAAKGLVEGMPVYTAIMERDASLLPAIKKEVSEQLGRIFGNENLRIPIQARVVIASKE